MKRVRGTGSADPRQMLIFWRFLIFCTAYVGFILKHLLFDHATKYGVINVRCGYRSSLPWHNAFTIESMYLSL